MSSSLFGLVWYVLPACCSLFLSSDLTSYPALLQVISTLVNLFGNKYKYLDALNNISIYWTSASVVIILVSVLVLAKNRRSADFVFTQFENSSGWPRWVRSACSALASVFLALCSHAETDRTTVCSLVAGLSLSGYCKVSKSPVCSMSRTAKNLF